MHFRMKIVGVFFFSKALYNDIYLHTRIFTKRGIKKHV